MFCPQCGSNQGDRRFCTTCGTNLAIVSQALHTPPGMSQPLANAPYMPPVITPYEMERQREYAKGMKMLLLGGAFLGYNLLKFIFSFGSASIGFWGFLGLVLLAIGLSKVLSWRQIAGEATHAVFSTVPQPEHQPQPQSTPATAQLRQTASPVPALSPPQPVFSALPPGVRTNELEPARPTIHAQAAPANFASSVTEDDTRHLPDQQTAQKERPAGH